MSVSGRPLISPAGSPGVRGLARVESLGTAGQTSFARVILCYGRVGNGVRTRGTDHSLRAYSPVGL